MSEITGYDEGTPCWVDLMTPDLARAQEFYARLFGWAYLDTGAQTGHYQLATVRGRQVAGLGQLPAGQSGQPHWTTYLWTDDADAAVARISAAGGSVLSGPHDVPSAGRTGIAADSTGAVFGLWQGGEHRGAQLANEPGAVAWNEYLGGDPAAAREFYRAAFGYTYDSYDDWEAEYATFKVRGEVRGGIGAKPPVLDPDAPNFWSTYFSVADTDAAAEAVARGGGAVLRPPFDTEVGRIAVAADPAGTPFCVISLPADPAADA
jgi:uncharacterized protein